MVPGIAASELYLDSERYWPPDTLTAMGKQLTPGEQKFEKALMFNTSGTPQNVNIYAANPSSTSYGADNTYTNLMQELQATYGSEYIVEFFPYDWRKTNYVAAQLLYEHINNKNYSEVIIVAHSMGGIVTSLCIANHGGFLNGVTTIGNAKLNKLITIGTPWLGAPKALYVLETGNFMDVFHKQFFSNLWMKNLAQNIPGIYELLPSERYFGNGNYYLERKIGASDPWRSLSYATTGEHIDKFFNKTVHSQAKGLVNSSNLNSVYNKIIDGSINAYVIVGHNVKTISYMLMNDLGSANTVEIKWGDGTVPINSATFNFAEMQRKPYYVDKVNHTDLVKASNSTLQLVKNIINGVGDIPPGVTRSITAKNTFTGYKITAACPVDLTVLDNSNHWLGTVTSEGTDAVEEHNFDFYVCGEDNEIKIAFVNDISKIEIEGTGNGTMDFSIEQHVNGAVSKSIEYTNVPIADSTIIKTDTNLNDDPKLYVDTNGDGNTDTEVQPDTINDNAKSYFKLWGKVTNWEKTPLNWFLLIACFGWIWM